MYDKETNSEWSHILGEAQAGKFKGKSLKQFPCVMTDWKTWSERHPEGSVVVLKRSARNFDTKYIGRPNNFALGIADGKDAKAWVFSGLEMTPVVMDTWKGQPVVVLYDGKSKTARLFDCRVKKKSLTFAEKDGTIIDNETQSTWDFMTGKALKGPMTGEQLEAMPAIPTFTRTWQEFHPMSEMWPKR